MTLPPGSRIREGQKVLLSYFHTAIIYEEQVMCCMAEPKLYEILRWQIGQVHKHLQPDGYFLQHDEIRVQGWDESCRQHAARRPAELLAENVRKCVEMVRAEDAGKPIYVWSDMFDPHAQCPEDRPVLPGQGRRPVVRLLEGPGQGRGDRQLELGSRQADRVAAALRGPGPPADPGRVLRRAGGRIRGWLRDGEQVQGIVGAMYTTWQRQYRDLEDFAAQLQPQ